MGLNTKCPVHGSDHPDYLCPCADNQKIFRDFLESIKNLLFPFISASKSIEISELRKLFNKKIGQKKLNVFRWSLDHVESCKQCQEAVGREYDDLSVWIDPWVH